MYLLGLSLCSLHTHTHVRRHITSAAIDAGKIEVFAPPLATVPIVTRGGEQRSNTEREHLWSRQRGAIQRGR